MVAIDASNKQPRPIFDLFMEAFTQFLHEQRDPIKDGTAERNLCHHLGNAIGALKEKYGFGAYTIDPEYNRMYGTVKSIFDNGEIIPVTCDIILHGRGKIDPDNILAVEMKKAEHSEQAKESDRRRLRAMTRKLNDGVYLVGGRPEHVCGYALGVLIEIDVKTKHFKVESYEQGAHVQTQEGAFPE